MEEEPEAEEELPLWQMVPSHKYTRWEEALQKYLPCTILSRISHLPIEGTS